MIIIKNKIMFIDLETGGLDSEKNSITQISGLIIVGGEQKLTFNFYVKPNPNLITDENALKIQGKTLDDFKSSIYEDEKVVYDKLLKIMNEFIDPFNKEDKFYIGGYNVKFDISFIESLFKRYNNYYLHSYIKPSTLDPLNIIPTLQIIGYLPQLKNNKLETWCEYFNIDIKAHDSLSDIIATKKLWIKLAKMIANKPDVNKYKVGYEYENK